jgi:hypothetical protein
VRSGSTELAASRDKKQHHNRCVFKKGRVFFCGFLLASRVPPVAHETGTPGLGQPHANPKSEIRNPQLP